MRKLVLSVLVALFCFVSIPSIVYSQDGSRRRPPADDQDRAVPRDRSGDRGVRPPPAPPQRYDPQRRSYVRHYYYNGRWNHRLPPQHRYRERRGRGWRVTICVPGYWEFYGYDYWGYPRYYWIREMCFYR